MKTPSMILKCAALIMLLGLASCQTSKTSNQYVRRDDKAPLVDDKYSLQADRQKMEDLRQEVSPERRRENDEVAFVMQMFQDVRRSPQDIRAQFDQTVRKKRDLMNRDLQKERDQFTKAERQKRDTFLKDQKNARDAFLRTKPAKDPREEFFKDQEEKRKDFFADEREKRGDYESDVRERRKNFEDYVREKQSEFNQEYRVYSRKYDDLKKERELQRKSGAPPSSAGPAPLAPVSSGNAEADQLMNDINALKNQPGTPLESGE